MKWELILGHVFGKHASSPKHYRGPFEAISFDSFAAAMTFKDGLPYRTWIGLGDDRRPRIVRQADENERRRE